MMTTKEPLPPILPFIAYLVDCVIGLALWWAAGTLGFLIPSMPAAQNLSAGSLKGACWLVRNLLKLKINGINRVLRWSDFCLQYNIPIPAHLTRGLRDWVNSTDTYLSTASK